MKSWSMHLCRVRGIELTVHASMLLWAGWWAWLGADAGGWPGAVWALLLLAAFCTCVLLHELGHSLVALRYGVRVPRILLLPIGGVAQLDHIPRRPRQEVAITVAGPAVNFALVLLLLPWTRLAPDWWRLEFALDAGGFLQAVLLMNLVMGLFNLLPIFPMDGGRLLRALLASRLTYYRATWWAATAGKVLAVAAGGTAAWFGGWLALVLFAFVFVSGELELRAVRHADSEAEHWRLWQARRAALAGDADASGSSS